MKQIPANQGGLQYRLPSLPFLNINKDVFSNEGASSPDFKYYISFILHKCLLIRKQYSCLELEKVCTFDIIF